MMSFRNNRLRQFTLPMSTAWVLNEIAQARGRQELFTRQSPQVLRALREQALIQSAESSNRIEGVTISPDRVQPLVLGRSPPRDRSEQDVQGYRLALNEIYNRHARLPITPEVMLRLHALCQAGSGDAGHFKRVDNELVQLVDGGPPLVRFRCVSVWATPAAVAELSALYRHAVEQEQIPPLIALGALVLDFLCIHPFRDGNGCVSRLLTLLALYHHGYEVGRYVSLEGLVKTSKEDYYECLYRSWQRWHEGRHDLTPWLNFFLGVLRRAYAELERRAAEMRSPRGAKTRLVEEAIASTPGEFGVAELERLCPGVSRHMIRLVLRELKAQGRVVCRSRGPGAQWRKKSNAPEKR